MRIAAMTASKFSSGSPFVFLQREQHLRQNLASRQIANQSQLRRQAELAIHRATRLRGNTNGLPPLAGHKNRFHRRRPYRSSLLRTLLCALCVLCGESVLLRSLSTRQRKQIPHRSIRRRILLPHHRQRDPRLMRQTFAKRRRQVGHLRHVELPFPVQRMVNLPTAKSRFTQRLTKFAQLVFRFA
jgi:hypothetical protein